MTIKLPKRTFKIKIPIGGNKGPKEEHFQDLVGIEIGDKFTYGLGKFRFTVVYMEYNIIHNNIRINCSMY